jgi:hypothetical protein
MKDSFSSLIKEAHSLLVLLPVRPTFDQVAAGLALYLSLSKDREISISCPSPMLVDMNRLIGVNKITQETGNKNLIIKFNDYNPTDVERVFYDVEDGKFKLTFVPLPQKTPPTKDQIAVTYAGISSDFVILVGGENESQFPDISTKDFLGSKLVHLGPKDISMGNGKHIISFARPSSSHSEVVAQIIKESDLHIDADVATNLVMGIEQSTSTFSGEGVTGETFALIGDLMQKGGKRMPKTPLAPAFPPGIIPGMPARSPQLSPFGPFPQFPQQISPEFPQQESMVTDEDQLEKEGEKAPTDWFKPKVFKGTSAS